MKLTDLVVPADLKRFEEEMHLMSGMNCYLYGPEGGRLTDFTGWGNRLCPVIKSNPASAQAICAVANQTIMAESARSGETVVLDCDAGFIKICIPILEQEALLGALGVCGRLRDHEEVEAFLVSKATGLEQDKIMELAATARRLSKPQLTQLVREMEDRVSIWLNRRTLNR